MSRILDLGTRIQPFGDAVGSLPFLGRSLAELRDEEVRASGVDPGRLTFADHALATAPILRAFAAAAPRGAPSVLALPVSSSSALFAPLSSIERRGEIHVLDVFLDGGEHASLPDLRRAATPVLVQPEGRTLRVEQPRLGSPPHHLELPADGAIAAHVEHWAHVLWLQPALVFRLLARAEEQAPERGLRLRAAGRHLLPSLVAADAYVHPRAHLEGSIVGPGARIKAEAHLRFSSVGADCTIGERSTLLRSVVGPGAHTLIDTNFVDVVSLGGGTLSSYLLRDTLLGREVFLTSGAIFWGEDDGRNIRTEHHGTRADSGRRFLGGCAGHGSILGTRTIIAPGVALPNRTVITMRREEGMLRVAPAAPGTAMCWHDAALVPVTQIWPGFVPDELAAGHAGPAPRRS